MSVYEDAGVSLCLTEVGMNSSYGIHLQVLAQAILARRPGSCETLPRVLPACLAVAEV